MRLPGFLLIIGFLLISGCASTASTPEPKTALLYEEPSTVSTELFSVNFAGFVYNLEAEEPYANYEISMDVLQPQEENIYMKVSFSDPENTERKLVKKLLVRPAATKVNVTSGDVYGLRGDWDYWIEVTAYADEDLSIEIDQFKQRVRSYVDWETIRQ